jgi:PAS domain S-box-containing protein
MSEAVANRAGRARADATRDAAQHRRTAVVALLVCAAYYFTAKIGFAFTLEPGSISTLWMPNSILLAALLLMPPRAWWIVLLAALPAHLAAELQSGVPTAMVFSWFVSNSFQALIGAVCINTLIDAPLRFGSFRHLIIFLLLGAFLAPFLSSFLDIALVKFNDWGTGSYWASWRIRFLSNVLATLTLVPVIVTWATGGITAALSAPLRRYTEASLLAVGLFAVGVVVFSSQQGVADMTPSLLYWPLPFLLWAAVRFGPQGASTCLLLVMFLTISGATHGQGPFVANSSAENALSLQWFLIVVSIPMMSLAAVIAERKRTEEALQQSEARLARTEAFSLVMATHVGLDGRWLKVPPTLCALLGYTEQELLAGTFQDVTHPDDIEADWSQCQRLIRGEIRSFDLEKRYLHKDGHTIWIYLNCSAVEDDHGKLIHFLTYIKNITDSKLAEQALLESNERNQAILRALPDMTFLNNKEGVYLDYYTRDPSSLLVSPEVFLGKNIRDVLPHELAERFMDCIRRLEGTRETQVLEYSLPICGEVRDYEARLVVAEGDKILSIVRDVTETRRAADALRLGEEKLLQSHQQIRALAARLITAQESERRHISLQLHDDLSQNVATLGVAISRLKRKLPPSREEIVAELDHLGQHTNDLTTQIRRLSHQLHPAVLEHLGLVAALESQVTEFGHEEQIDVKFDAQMRSEKVPLNVSVCLYRVALEALRNISRHSDASSARISLVETGDSLTLEVSDSGHGFDVERARRGSGLGLISAEERVKLLQGAFEVSSNPGSGTILVARIPLAEGL